MDELVFWLPGKQRMSIYASSSFLATCGGGTANGDGDSDSGGVAEG